MKNLSPLEIASKNLITIEVDEQVVTAHNLMRAKKIRHLLVTAGGKAVGVMSDRDLMKALRLEVQDFYSIKVKDESYDPKLKIFDIMSWPMKSVEETVPLIDVVNIILDEKISAVLITKQSAVIGIITTDDLMLILKHHLMEDQQSFWGESIVNNFYGTPMRAVMEVLSNTGI